MPFGDAATGGVMSSYRGAFPMKRSAAAKMARRISFAQTGIAAVAASSMRSSPHSSSSELSALLIPSVYVIRASPGEGVRERSSNSTFCRRPTTEPVASRSMRRRRAAGRVVSGVHVSEQAGRGIADGEEEGRVAIGGRGFENELVHLLHERGEIELGGFPQTDEGHGAQAGAGEVFSCGIKLQTIRRVVPGWSVSGSY
jgi:hypothetical protein